MGNDLAFRIYAGVMVGGVVATMATVATLGLGEVPTVFQWVEHVGAGLLFRHVYQNLPVVTV